MDCLLNEERDLIEAKRKELQSQQASFTMARCIFGPAALINSRKSFVHTLKAYCLELTRITEGLTFRGFIDLFPSGQAEVVVCEKPQETDLVLISLPVPRVCDSWTFKLLQLVT